VLVDPDDLAAMPPAARVLAGIARALPALLDAYRQGSLVPPVPEDVDDREGRAGMIRPLFVNLLAGEWLPALPDVHARLKADPPARVALVGTGVGWLGIALARAYPKVAVDGYDDQSSVALARANAAAAGVGDRVRAQVLDLDGLAPTGRYDLAFAFDPFQGATRPVDAFRALRRLVGDGGTVLIAGPRIANRFVAPGDARECMAYGLGTLRRRAVGPVDELPAESDAVPRESTIRRVAAVAGFRNVEIAPIADEWWRFYRLTA
jgi:SAM-dependent methyltransferase